MIELPFVPTIEEGADWLELSSFLNYPHPIPETVVKSYFDSINEENERKLATEETRVEYVSETLFTDIIRLMKWRESLMTPDYPFFVENGRISAKEDILDKLEYSFPLLLSTHKFYPETEISDWSHIGDLFELFCTTAISQIFGNAALIGNTYGGFPNTFDECLTEVCKAMNEETGSKELTDFQDAGVDIIGWKKIDERKGQIVVLVQCASGKNWKRKGGDIVPDLWCKLVHWAVNPIKALAFPYAYGFEKDRAERRWTTYSFRSGLLLDRLRLGRFSLSESRMDLKPIFDWACEQASKIYSHRLED